MRVVERPCLLWRARGANARPCPPSLTSAAAAASQFPPKPRTRRRRVGRRAHRDAQLGQVAGQLVGHGHFQVAGVALLAVAARVREHDRPAAAAACIVIGIAAAVGSSSAAGGPALGGAAGRGLDFEDARVEARGPAVQRVGAVVDREAVLAAVEREAALLEAGRGGRRERRMRRREGVEADEMPLGSATQGSCWPRQRSDPFAGRQAAN